MINIINLHNANLHKIDFKTDFTIELIEGRRLHRATVRTFMKTLTGLKILFLISMGGTGRDDISMQLASRDFQPSWIYINKHNKLSNPESRLIFKVIINVML